MKYQRRIPFENANNFRDLGGFATPDGTTAWGKLFRTETLRYLSEADWQKLKDLGVRTLIDLRGEKEAVDNPVNAPADFTYVNIPLMSSHGKMGDYPGNNADASGKKDFVASLLIPYSDIFADSLPAPAIVLNKITDALDEGSAAFFCSAGKDRTGIITSAILTLCGVAREDIIADYIVTYVFNSAPNRGVYPRLMRDMRIVSSAEGSTPAAPGSIAALMDSRAETIEDLLDYFEKNDLPAILNSNGFTYEQQAALVSKMSQ